MTWRAECVRQERTGLGISPTRGRPGQDRAVAGATRQRCSARDLMWSSLDMQIARTAGLEGRFELCSKHISKIPLLVQTWPEVYCSCFHLVDGLWISRPLSHFFLMPADTSVLWLDETQKFAKYPNFTWEKQKFCGLFASVCLSVFLCTVRWTLLQEETKLFELKNELYEGDLQEDRVCKSTAKIPAYISATLCTSVCQTALLQTAMELCSPVVGLN